MYYPIQLDKSRNLKFGMRAIDRIEKKFKKPITKIDLENLTMEETATMIWAGLVHEDRDLKPEKVMDLVDDYSDITTVMNVVTDAMQAAFGTEEEAKEDEKNV